MLALDVRCVERSCPRAPQAKPAKPRAYPLESTSASYPSEPVVYRFGIPHYRELPMNSANVCYCLQTMMDRVKCLCFSEETGYRMVYN